MLAIIIWGEVAKIEWHQIITMWQVLGGNVELQIRDF